jgi:hypothetical protein
MLSSLYKTTSLFIIVLVLLSSCATPRLTYTNFSKIQKGMTEGEVIKLLGEPTDVTSVSLDTGIGAIFGLDELSGTNMIWKTYDAKANVIFFKGKVKSANFTNQF